MAVLFGRRVSKPYFVTVFESEFSLTMTSKSDEGYTIVRRVKETHIRRYLRFVPSDIPHTLML